MVATTLTRLSQDYLAAFNSHDMDKFLSFYAGDCVVEDTGLGTVFHGLQEFKESYSDFFKAFPDIRMEIRTDFRSGDWSATEWVMNGTNKGNIAQVGNLPETPATNKNIHFKGATISQWHNNKIIRETDYYNPVTMMQQLGLMPEMPAK
jgi:steroid delta-isomerase-like uncharacterized protein